MEKMIALVEHQIPGTVTGEGPFGSPGEQSLPLLTQIISITIGLLTLIAGVFFFFILLSGAIGWISSGGDRQKIESAKQRVFNGVIGIVVVVAAIFIIQIAGGIIGFPDILRPQLTISRLFPGNVGRTGLVRCTGNYTTCNDFCASIPGSSCVHSCGVMPHCTPDFGYYIPGVGCGFCSATFGNTCSALDPIGGVYCCCN